MELTTHERPGVYSAYDASTVVSGSGGGKVAGLAALVTGETDGALVRVSRYEDAVAAFGEDEAITELIRLLLLNGAAAVAAVPVADAEGYDDAFAALEAVEDVQIMVCDSDTLTVQQAMRDSIKAASEARKERIGVVLGGIDFYPKKKVRLLSDVTRRFYGNWQEEKYRHYLNLFGIDQEKRVDQLSTGMRVKYMIALALSHDARLLILDEPTSGLDPVSRDELTELLRRIAADGHRSVLFSTHITSDLEKCASHITFIKDGTIQHTGTLADFQQHYDYLRQPGQELTLEDIIVSVERRPLDENAII